MGKSKAPPAPNYGPLIAAQTQAAERANELAQQQFDWAKQQYAEDRKTTDRVVEAALNTQARNDQYAQEDRERYKNIYQPLEDQYIDQIDRYSDPNAVAARAGAAAGDVSQQFEIGRDNARRQLEAYGVDPTQTRAAALDLGTRTQEAAARASAMNVSRRADEAAAQEQRMGAINVGRGYPGQSLAASGQGLQAGSGAVSSVLGTTGSGASTMGTAPQYQGLAAQSLAGAANTMNTQYKNQLDRTKMNNEASSGIGGFLGTAAGLGLKFATSGLFKEGGAVPEPDDMHAGVQIARELSPSGGMDTDDVPARLNAGEYVLPEDTVRWVGEKSLQAMITKSREERQGATAKPRIGALPVERPVVDTTGALAVRR